MKNALLITLRFLDGRYHGRDNRKASEWPPAPARLLQALLAGCARGQLVPEIDLEALDWLAELNPPIICAPPGKPGQSYTNYVPNNDFDTALGVILSSGMGTWDNVVAKIRRTEKTKKIWVGKRIEPILFDTAVPIIYCWFYGDGRQEKPMAVCEMAKGLYQFGRTVDVAWADATVCKAEKANQIILSHGGIVYYPTGGDEGDSQNALLCPAPGLRKGLQKQFQDSMARFGLAEDNGARVSVFSQPSNPRLRKIAYNAKRRRFVFDLRDVNKSDAFNAKPLSAAARLIEQVRDKAAEALAEETTPALREKIDRYLIGRGAGEKDKVGRVLITPIPSVGHEHADMMIRRVAVYTPQSCPIPLPDLEWAFSTVAWCDDDGVVTGGLQQTDDTLMVERFENSARHWQSVTPLALPMTKRKKRAERQAEVAMAFRQALRHAGVKSAVAEIRAQREPFQPHGVRAEEFATNTRFHKGALWHVDVVFNEPVQGPLALGNGRFLGLGLMQPEPAPPELLAFGITGGLSANASYKDVASAARRAMIARVQESLGRGEEVPEYVSGHQKDGRPADNSVHRHIAVVADLARGRILFLAPTLLSRHGVARKAVYQDHRRLARALEGLRVLRAGPAGRLTLAPVIPDMDTDPLFAPAKVWESETDYHVTRHPRRVADEDALKADVAMELQRRGWPSPQAIEVLSSRRGTNRDLSGRLRVAFAVAQAGPLLIGRTSHKGGGCFSAAPK